MSRLALIASFLALPAFAAREGYTRLSYAGSDVTLLSTDQDDTQARSNMPVLAGDKIQTGASSRAEAILSDGNVVRFDARTDMRFDRLARTYQSDDDRDLLFLERGAVEVDVRFASSLAQALRIDTEDATIVFPENGTFRLDAGRRGTEIYVESGHAEVTARSGRATVNAGEYAYVAGDDAIEIDEGGLPRDRFARFCDERRNRSPRVEDVKYVGADYEYDAQDAAFDDYGDWVYVSSVGQRCWRPSVSADWCPYGQGYWRWTPCGLTWVSYEPWGWLPYHYGTWTFDVGFGWCWLPGFSYSPAWVYWSYTPGYIGWCPVGYYGYYDNYYRSRRGLYGTEGRGGMVYPHLAGHVDVTQIDPRGWNYVAAGRVGTRLDPPRDIVRRDRVPFRAGEIAVVETAPLRIDRTPGRGLAAAVQDAVRRVPVQAGSLGVRPGAGGVSEGLTSILRRDARLTPAASEVLRGAYVRADRDVNYRPVAPEAVASPRRFDAGTGGAPGVRPGAGGGAIVGERGGWRTDRPSEAPVRRGDFDRENGGTGVRPGASTPVSPAPRGGEVIRRDSWRDGGSEGVRPRDEAQRRGSETPARPAPRGDDGWRSQSPPSPRPVERRSSEDRPAPRRDDSSWRAPQPREVRPGNDSPRHEAPTREAPAPRHEAPAPRPEPRSNQSTRSYDAPRYESRPAPRFESHSAPAPAPRYEYHAPAPRPEYHPAPAPAPRIESHPAPAPHYESPHGSAPQRRG